MKTRVHAIHGRALGAIVLVASLGASSLAQEVRVQEGSFRPGNSKIYVRQNMGYVVVSFKRGDAVSYRAEFSPDWGKRKSSSNVKVDENARRIDITAENGVNQTTRLTIPIGKELDIKLGTGTLIIKGTPGRLDATVTDGTLNLDSSLLPSDSCVSARGEYGSIMTPWGNSMGVHPALSQCEPATIKLRIYTGTIKVQ